MGKWPSDLEFGDEVLVILRLHVANASEHTFQAEEGDVFYPDSDGLVAVLKVGADG